MKGVILAGGLGSRLGDLTKITNKHLLPVYDKPMIYYPIQTLVKAGIKDIMIIVSGPHAGDFIPILKNGEEFGLSSLQFGYQWKPNGGIADALSIARDFVGGQSCCVILGDNTTDADISEGVELFDKKYAKILTDRHHIPRAHLYLKEVEDPERYGVADVSLLADQYGNQLIKSIEEKPKNPKSNLAVTGIYIYSYDVFYFIDQCSPSERGELEITDVNNIYLKDGSISFTMLNGFWSDAGTFDSLYKSNKWWAEKADRDQMNKALK